MKFITGNQQPGDWLQLLACTRRVGLARSEHASVLAGLLSLLVIVQPNAMAAAVIPAPTTTYLVDASDIAAAMPDMLPETSQVNVDFLDPMYSPLITLSEPASVSITFVHEGAGYRNSMGYFLFDAALLDVTKSTIDTDSSGVVDIDELTAITGDEPDSLISKVGLLFDNASMLNAGGNLVAGTTVDLAGGDTIPADTVIGFFLIQNGYRGFWGGVKGVDDSSKPRVFYNVDHLNPESPPDATHTLVETADMMSRHIAMMFYELEVVFGFEDLHRLDQQSDDDFNDAVFFASATPDTAVLGNNIPVYRAIPIPEPSSGLLAIMGLLSFWRIRAVPSAARGSNLKH